MKPLEAGFDGAKGISLGMPHLKDGGKYILKRDSRSPLEFPTTNFRNQLIWYYPEGKDPTLFFCNNDGEWFDLSFTPVTLGEL